MTSLQEHEQPVDPRLEEMLDLLRHTPPMDQEMVARGQVKFLAEVDALFEPSSSSVFTWMTGWFSTQFQVKEKFAMTTSKQRFVYTTFGILLAIFVLLFGGATATAYASQSSLPGDALYPVKTGLEQTRVNLSNDAADQANLHLEFAQRRLGEMAALIAEGRFTSINEATSEFEYHVQQAIEAIQVVAVGDPARAEELAAQIASALSGYASTLSGMMVNVPDTIKPAFERAMMASHPIGSATAEEEIEFTGEVEAMASDTWKVEGRVLSINSQTEIEGSIIVGDTVEVHAYVADDGMLTAREIELVVPEDNGNENANGNDNDDLEDYDNANDNDDDYGNANGENDNGDDVDEGNDNDDNDDDDYGNDNEADDDDANNGNDNDNEEYNDNENGDNDNDDENDGNDNNNENDGNNNDNDDDDNENDGGDGDNSNDDDNENDVGDGDDEDESDG